MENKVLGGHVRELAVQALQIRIVLFVSLRVHLFEESRCLDGEAFGAAMIFVVEAVHEKERVAEECRIAIPAVRRQGAGKVVQDDLLALRDTRVYDERPHS